MISANISIAFAFNCSSTIASAIGNKISANKFKSALSTPFSTPTTNPKSFKTDWTFVSSLKISATVSSPKFEKSVIPSSVNAP